MGDTGNIRFPGNLDPEAKEFRPGNPSPRNQITLLQPPVYFPCPSTGVHVMPLYDGGIGYQQSLPSTAYVSHTGGANPPLPPPLPPPSASATRTLLLSSVSTDVTEANVRRDLEVFGEVRAVQMERLQEGIATVHFYDLRHAQAAMLEIKEQHMQQQIRLRKHYDSFIRNLGLQPENSALPIPPPARGLISGHAVWAQFVVPSTIVGPDGPNQGTLVIFNLDSEVSASHLKEIFGAFGHVKELRETPLKRHQRFVEFFDIRDAARSLSEMNGKEINGKHVIVEFSRPGGHNRRLFNAITTNTTTSNNNSFDSIKTRINYHTGNSNCPPLLPPRLSSRSTTDGPAHSNFSQTYPPTKRTGAISGNCSWNNNQRSNNGAVAAASMASLSLGVVGNGIEPERDYSGSSRRNTKKSNNNQSATRKQQQQQLRTRSWKGRRKSLDAHFLINDEEMVESICRDPRTTVMIKNIPNKYSQKLLLNMLDNHCIHCNEQIADGDEQPLSSYDFVYLPIDFNNKCNVGYGFVNLTSPQATWRLYKSFHFQPWEVFNSRKICEITYARLQGLEALKEHFKNSKFACETDEYLPVAFSPPRDGKRLTEPQAIVGHANPAVSMKLIMGVGDENNETVDVGDSDDGDDDEVSESYNGGDDDDEDEDYVDGGEPPLPEVLFSSTTLLQQLHHPMGAC